MRRVSFVAALALAACGTEPPPPGTLTVSLAEISPFSTSTGIIVQGVVTREPAIADLSLVVTVAAGGTTIVDTAATDGAFSVALTLTPNSTTTISVTASDASGSTGPAATATVTHDGTPPAVTQWTPTDLSDLATPAAVSVRFNEPIRPESVTLSVVEQGAAIAGAVVASADSTTFTFTPTNPFPANAILRATASGVRDVAGNLTGALGMCFTMGGANATFSDPASDFFTINAVADPTTVPTDLTSFRLSATSTHLRTVLRYTTPRSFLATDPANTFVAIDIDADNDTTTGFPAVAEVLFASGIPPAHVGSDFAIILFVRETNTDSAVVVQWTDTLTGTSTHVFLHEACGENVGFVIPRASIGDDDGSFRAVVFTDVRDAQDAGFGDLLPDSAHVAISLPAPAPALTTPALMMQLRPTRIDVRRMLERRSPNRPRNP